MRIQTNLNAGWRYSPSRAAGAEEPAFDDSSWEEVDLPHTNREVPLAYFDDGICGFVSGYRKKIVLKKGEGRRWRLCFEGIANAAKLYVNGSFAGEHRCAYTDFYADVTDLLRDGENLIFVEVDSTERPDVPPFGGVVDYLAYGGIYRDAWLIETDEVYLSDVYCRAEGDDLHRLSVEVSLCGGDRETTVRLLDGARVIAERAGKTVNGKGSFLFGELPVEPWSPSYPKLYTVEAETEGDCYSLRFGFRRAEFTPRGFFLNGERLQLVGLNRHQSYPYRGYAMPRNAQREDADLLKRCGLNLVRTSHYPQSRHFLDRCDELGLLVFEEIPGWNHIGDEAWKAQTEENLRAMILRDRSRPSVILWGVRINESEDDHAFYLRTNALARALDTRPTAGVRWKPHSELLEDVFAINDFVPLYEEPPLRDPRAETGLSYDVPYLVTEYMGHMFPTKLTDPEERLSRQALRHAEIQNRARSDERISGAIGWCAFDYHTHRHFGTNDKVCYHGVFDMFRNPKYAAYAYASQKPPEEGIVFEPATIWAFGERDIGGVTPLYIYTNAEEVVLEMAGREPLRYKPAREKFPHLPHPPVVIEKMPEVWGSTWTDAVFRAYIKGKCVAVRRYSANPVPARLELTTETEQARRGDSVRFVARALDDAGNVMKFFEEPLFIAVEGGKLIGPSAAVWKGGMRTFWAIASGDVVRARVTSERLGSAEAEISTVEYEDHYSL